MQTLAVSIYLFDDCTAITEKREEWFLRARLRRESSGTNVNPAIQYIQRRDDGDSRNQ